MPFRIVAPETEQEFERYYELRWRILAAPWNQPRGIERDELEDEAVHLMVCAEDRVPVAVGRVHLNMPSQAQIRYMGVADEWQGQGLGRLLLQGLEAVARERGATEVVLNARENAVGFYERCGYRVIAPAHLLFGCIPHFRMHKVLESSE